MVENVIENISTADSVRSAVTETQRKMAVSHAVPFL